MPCIGAGSVENACSMGAVRIRVSRRSDGRSSRQASGRPARPEARPQGDALAGDRASGFGRSSRLRSITSSPISSSRNLAAAGSRLAVPPVDDRQRAGQAVVRVRRPRSGSATSVPALTSWASEGSGRMEIPEGISTARLMFSMLSNSRIDLDLDVVMPQEAVDRPADRQVGIEGDERLAVELGHGDARPAARSGATDGPPAPSPPRAR